MDDKACLRLAGKVVILALRDIRKGDKSAEQWLKESKQADVFLSGLNLDHLDREKIITRVKSGKGRLSTTGNKWY